MMTVIVIEPGSKVVIGEQINADVVSVQIGSNNVVTYLCSWWADSERKTEWLERWQVELKEGEESLRVRFKE